MHITRLTLSFLWFVLGSWAAFHDTMSIATILVFSPLVEDSKCVHLTVLDMVRLHRRSFLYVVISVCETFIFWVISTHNEIRRTSNIRTREESCHIGTTSAGYRNLRHPLITGVRAVKESHRQPDRRSCSAVNAFNHYLPYRGYVRRIKDDKFIDWCNVEFTMIENSGFPREKVPRDSLLRMGYKNVKMTGVPVYV